MSLKTDRELNAQAKTLVARAKQAEQSKNYDYAISLMQAALKEEPLYLDGRHYLRAIEIQKFKGMNSFSKQMQSMKVSTLAMKLSSKKTPEEQLVSAEEVLALDPYQSKANAMIGDAGEALGYPDFKAFAYETLAEGTKPDDIKAMKAILNTLAEAYMAMKTEKSFEKAIKTYDRIITLDPRDGDALTRLNSATAAHASLKGKWEQAGDYRTQIKDLKEAEQLEAQNRAVKSASGVEEQIAVSFQKYEADPNNTLHSKAIAKLYYDKGDYENAIIWYNEAFTKGGKIDSSIEKTIGELKQKKVEQDLKALMDGLAVQTDPEQQAAYQAAIAEKEKEVNDVRLFQAEASVRAHPNEGENRFALGEALFKVGQYKRATEELQLSLKAPSVRYQALNLMGQSFMKRGMLDFAVKQLALAQSELVGMDDTKKEITYNLGLAYELAKQSEKSLDQWKLIYEYDMSYRDVSQRVEDSYGQSSES